MSTSAEYPTQEELEQLGQQYMQENPEEYDTADLEALGAAVYVEQSPLSEEMALVDIAQYIDNTSDFHEQRFKLYKGAMGGDRFEEDIIERVSEAVQEANQSGFKGGYATVWEALYREKVEDLDEADETIEGILEEISELEDDESDLSFDGNMNWGNQVLSEQPEENINMGNQVVLEDSNSRSSGKNDTESTRENSEELYDWWDEEMDTGNPDQL